MQSLPVNLPEVVEQLRAAFERYERALIEHDLDTLNAFFWADPATLRYGLAEHAYGYDAVRRSRLTAAPVDPGRHLRRTVVTTFGDAFGSVCAEFVAPGGGDVGRQTQTWVRFPQGWRIVAAHVSRIPADGLSVY